MRLITALLVLSGALALTALSQQSNSPQTPASSAIPDDEAHFTPDQMKQYYLVYTNPDVRYLRTLFDAFLQGKSGHEGEFSLLSNWSSDYFRSKFIVCSRDANPFGGEIIAIMFQNKPDKVFQTWVYPAGAQRVLELRAFEAAKFTDDDIRRFRVRYRVFLEDKDHAM